MNTLGSNAAQVCELIKPLHPVLRRATERGNSFVKGQAKLHSGKAAKVERGSLASLRQRLEHSKGIQIIGDIFTAKMKPEVVKAVKPNETGRHTGIDYKAANAANDLVFRDRITGAEIGRASSYRLPHTIMG